MVGDATPRISARQLQEFTNQRIRIVGKVVQLMGETATLEADGQESHVKVGNAAEVIGKVRSDQTVQVMKATDFGANFDYEANKAVVEATHKYREIFYEPPTQAW